MVVVTAVFGKLSHEYCRYEFAIEMFLKKIPIAYRLVQMDSVDFRLFIATHILHKLTTSADEW